MTKRKNEILVSKAAELYAELQSSNAVAAALGVGRTTVKRWLRCRGLLNKPKTAKSHHCEKCGATFKGKAYVRQNGLTRFCSKECSRSQNKRGKEHATLAFNKKTGRWHRQWREHGSNQVFSILQSRWIWEMKHGSVPKGYEIHHVNGDRTDDKLENLAMIEAREHDRLHALERLQRNIVEINGTAHRRCPACEEFVAVAVWPMANKRLGRRASYCRACLNAFMRQRNRGRNAARRSIPKRSADTCTRGQKKGEEHTN